MALKVLPPKSRGFSAGIKENGPFSVITIDTLVDNLIAKSVLDSGTVSVILDRTPDELDGDELDVLLAVKGETLKSIATIELGPIADRPAGKIPLSIPASHFTELPKPAGPTGYQIQIKVYKGGGGIEDPSNIIDVLIDQTAPFSTKDPRREEKPTPPPVFVNKPADPQVTVNEAWMAANANVNLTVNVGYDERRPDDEIQVSLRAGSQSVEVYYDTVPNNGAITFPNSELRKFPPKGRVNIVQRYYDVVGNPSLVSAPAPFLTLNLAQKPILNKAPLVPKTDPNYSKSLYLDDVAGGISAIVESASIDSAEAGDEIFLTIEDADDATLFKELDPQTWTGGNLTFDLSYDDLAKIFDKADEPKRIMIKSTITRTGMTPDVESPDAIFILAFDHAGPENPDLPDLTNRNMELPVVTGASGTVNSLLPGDRDKPATFKVKFKLADPPITPDQTAKCYINEVALDDYAPFVDETEFEVPIPARIVAGLTTPSVKARWTIQKSGDDKNIMRSREETVLVAGPSIPLPLPTVRIRNEIKRPFVECFAMDSPTKEYNLGLEIPKTPLLPPGKTIKVFFEAHRNSTGTDLIPNTRVSADYIIKAADVPDFALTGTNPAIFKLAQPFKGAVSYAKYWYTTDINGEQSSVPFVREIDTISTSRNYCDGTAAPAAP